MIIEVVTGKSFDQSVKELVLDPHGLEGMHPQSDHAGLYQKAKSDSSVDIAVGYFIDGDLMRGGKDPKTVGGRKC